MYPPPFDYHRASSVPEALSLLADLPDATLLAGGHALIPHLKNGRAEPGAVVDVSDLPELAGVDVGREETVVGAATTYADLLAAKTADGIDLASLAPAFAEATRAVGDRQIRNRGTVGGNLAEAHPDSDLPAAALVADASVLVRDPTGEREVGVDEFLVGPFESAVGDDEIVTAVRIPHVDGDASEGADCGGSYVKKTHPTSGYAMVGVAARVAVTDGAVSSARLAANGVSDTAVRLSSVETALEGIDTDAADLDERVNEAAADAATDVPKSVRRGDVHASADYRVSVLPTYVERVVGSALDGAGVDEIDDPDAADASSGGERP
jgi:aerobic carbon-monoxide dehydrogenase medium subunit